MKLYILIYEINKKSAVKTELPAPLAWLWENDRGNVPSLLKYVMADGRRLPDGRWRVKKKSIAAKYCLDWFIYIFLFIYIFKQRTKIFKKASEIYPRASNVTSNVYMNTYRKQNTLYISKYAFIF